MSKQKVANVGRLVQLFSDAVEVLGDIEAVENAEANKRELDAVIAHARQDLEAVKAEVKSAGDELKSLDDQCFAAEERAEQVTKEADEYAARVKAEADAEAEAKQVEAKQLVEQGLAEFEEAKAKASGELEDVKIAVAEARQELAELRAKLEEAVQGALGSRDTKAG